MQEGGEVEEVGGLFVDSHGGTLRGIDLRDEVIGAIAAVLVLDAPGAGCHRLGYLPGLLFPFRFDQHFARAPHRAEPRDPERPAARQSLKWYPNWRITALKSGIWVLPNWLPISTSPGAFAFCR